MTAEDQRFRIATERGVFEGMFMPLDSNECGITLKTDGGKMYIPWKIILWENFLKPTPAIRKVS